MICCSWGSTCTSANNYRHKIKIPPKAHCCNLVGPLVHGLLTWLLGRMDMTSLWINFDHSKQRRPFTIHVYFHCHIGLFLTVLMTWPIHEYYLFHAILTNWISQHMPHMLTWFWNVYTIWKVHRIKYINVLFWKGVVKVTESQHESTCQWRMKVKWNFSRHALVEIWFWSWLNGGIYTNCHFYEGFFFNNLKHQCTF